MRKLEITLLLFVLLVVLLGAEEPKYPLTIRKFDSLKFKRVAQNQLPDGVFFWTSQCTESNEDPELTGEIVHLDLNGDGIDEIIVESQCKHENQFEFWQKRNKRWISLLTVWGQPDLLRKRNGYYQILASSEGRHGEGRRELYAFQGERYHCMRIDKYQDDVYGGTSSTREREQVLDLNFKQQFEQPNQ